MHRAIPTVALALTLTLAPGAGRPDVAAVPTEAALSQPAPAIGAT